MLEEIKDIIAKNLPAQVGETLQKELARIPELEKQLEVCEAARKAGIQLITEKDKTLGEYIAKENKYQELEKRELEVEKRERNLELAVMKVQVMETEKRATELQGLVQTVFKSPVYRTAYMNDLFSSYDNQGHYNMTGGTPREVTKTEE
jgi:flagellar biosynthesis/type III secretory pathway chaperone